MYLFFGLYYEDLLYAKGTLDYKYEGNIRVWGIYYTYAHLTCWIHVCRSCKSACSNAHVGQERMIVVGAVRGTSA